jgi:FMN-dependent NADH-azoreductase
VIIDVYSFWINRENGLVSRNPLANPTLEDTNMPTLPHHEVHTQTLNLLRVDSSGRRTQSVTRALADAVVAQFQAQGPVRVTSRDVARGVPFVTEEWIQANFTDPEQRTPQQQAVLAGSDTLVEELQQADMLILGAPVYNFGIPAALKAWIDMVARARLTFRYTENGPVGLLTGKRAIVLMASGGTPIGSETDFASRYLRHALGFIGITDVEIVAAEKLMAQGDAARLAALDQITGITAHPGRAAA